MSKANVFIIESLEFRDERKRRFEGRFLSQILRLSGKESKYYYIRTKKELEEVLEFFAKSDYRYLHLSCHGSKTSISTTIDEVSFPQLTRLAGPYLKDKRLFISACSAVNKNLAGHLIPQSGCFSVIGPPKKIPFDDAAITWASFYYLVFREDAKRMKRDAILTALTKVWAIFGIRMSYFRIRKDSTEGYERIKVPSHLQE